jgi:hypothetical protein
MEAVKNVIKMHNPSKENQAKFKYYKEVVNKTFRREKRQAEKNTLEKLEED